jgi:hypothetical protein
MNADRRIFFGFEEGSSARLHEILFCAKIFETKGKCPRNQGLVTRFDELSGSLFQVRLEFHPSGTTLGFLAPTFNYRGGVKG